MTTIDKNYCADDYTFAKTTVWLTTLLQKLLYG